MKDKLVLMFILGLFLISFTSATITIIIIDKPVLTLDLLDGGDLSPNTTYYFVGIFDKDTWYSTTNPSPYYMCSSGSASEQVNITTNDTHKQINMTWATPSTTNTFLRIKWDNVTLLNPDGSYKTAPGTKWNALYYNKGWSGINKTINTADLLSGLGGYGTYMNGQIAVSTEMPLGLDYTLGKPLVEITGTETYANLVTVLKASSIKTCFEFNQVGFIGYANIVGTGTITFDSKNIIMVGSALYGGNFTYTHSVYTVLSNGNWIYMRGRFNRSTVNPTNAGSYFNEATSTNKLTILNGANFGVYNPYSNLIFTNSGLRQRYITPAMEEAVNNDFHSGNLMLEQCSGYTGRNFRFYNNNVNNYGAYSVDIRTEPYKNATPVHYKFYDCITDRPTKYVAITNYYCNTGTWANISTHYYNFYFSTNITVTDKDGNKLSGVTITFVDKNGTTYTNPSEVISYYEKFINDNDRWATIYDLNPFNLTITKTGYETYTSTFNLTEKKDWTISLESRDWNYSQTLAWKILNITDTTILKLSKDGNLAIAGNLYENTNSPPPSENIIYKIAGVLWLTQKGNLYLVKELMEMVI